MSPNELESKFWSSRKRTFPNVESKLESDGCVLLQASDFSDRSAEDITRQISRLKLDLGDKKAKRKPKRLAVGEEEAAEVGAGALMIHVEKCLSRLRKSLSPATLANTQYAVALDWLSKQLKDGTLPLPFLQTQSTNSLYPSDTSNHSNRIGSGLDGSGYHLSLECLFLLLPTAAATKKDARHAIVPTSPEEWRILYAKWLQQAMLVLGLLPPDAAKVTNQLSTDHSRMCSPLPQPIYASYVQEV